MNRDMQQMVNLFLEGKIPKYEQIGWRPAADVYRIPRGWLLKLDLAGVESGDVKIQREGKSLTVRGTRRDCSVEECCQFHSMEISYNQFQRSIEFPTSVEHMELSTKYQDGMLFVRLTDKEGAS